MMENKKKKPDRKLLNICLAVFLGFTLTISSAQEAVVPSGGDATGSGGSAAYTVGQIFYVSYTGSNGSENQGVQQLNVENPLPVTLVSFEATPREGNEVLLRWTTSFELNNDYFTVERSSDGKNFRPLTKVSGKGDKQIQTNYEAIDYFPYTGNNYYRLKQTDYDGSFGYSRIRVAHIAASANDIAVYPNPTTDFLNIKTTGLKNENLTFQITSLNGMILSSQKASKETLAVVDLRKLSPAIYMVTVLEDNKAVKTFKVIKD